MAQFTLTAGLIRKARLTLAAIRLEGTGLASAGEVPEPAPDLLQQITGPDGLDFHDERSYCVGIFSPVGWPVRWKDQAEMKGNALFYLVEKVEGTRWGVSGPDSPIRDLFDPESKDEKSTRARDALAGHPGLILRGDQVAVDAFLEQESLDRETVRDVVEACSGRYLMIEHEGKFYIQRSLR